jgi:uncharacterized protein (TIGR02265 family)
MPSLQVDFVKADAALDLARRLADVPQTANVRGVFFNLIEHELARRGLADATAARRILGSPRKSFALYPTRDLLVAYAHAGALIDEDPAAGIRAIFFGTASYFAATWYGRAFQRYLRPDPADALRWIERSRAHIADYGHWRLEQRGPGHAIFHMVDEYFWIDSAQRGGCEGLLHACGVRGEVTAELDSRFCGRLDVRWTLPA